LHPLGIISKLDQQVHEPKMPEQNRHCFLKGFVLLQILILDFMLGNSEVNAFAFLKHEKLQLHRFGNFKTHVDKSYTPLKMNFLSDLGDALSGGKLAPQSELPYDPPFCPNHSISSDQPKTFAIRERALSFTGEDFDIYCPEQNAPIISVRGAMLHLPGKDKMRISSEGEEVVVLDRVLLAVTPSYDIYRGGMNAEKVAWIEKKIIALTETFDVYLESQEHFGPFKPPPAYEISGDFLERNFVMKNDKGEVVAKFSKVSTSPFSCFHLICVGHE